MQYKLSNWYESWSWHRIYASDTDSFIHGIEVDEWYCDKKMVEWMPLVRRTDNTQCTKGATDSMDLLAFGIVQLAYAVGEYFFFTMFDPYT